MKYLIFPSTRTNCMNLLSVMKMNCERELNNNEELNKDVPSSLVRAWEESTRGRIKILKECLVDLKDAEEIEL